MKAFLYSISILVAMPVILLAQPLPCTNPATMTPMCADACVVCDIDGFSGINNSTATGEAPPGFCTNTVHNAQWIAFQAASTNLTLSVSVFNCQSGGNNPQPGLEVGIYYSLDCDNFQLVSNCDGSIWPNTTQNFTNTVPLIIGQYYYFVMDGNGGDICQYTIHVVNGSTEVPAVTLPPTFSGALNPCSGTTQTYSIAPIVGATFYEWTVNDEMVSNSTSMNYAFPVPGHYEVCVSAGNVCYQADPLCQTVHIGQLQTVAEASICQGETYAFGGNNYTTSGHYTASFTSTNGCDSTVTLNLQVLPSVSSSFGAQICPGETYAFGGNTYTTSGQYTTTFTATNGCDSTVTLNLQVLPSVSSSFGAQICPGETYAFGGNNYTTSGQYTTTFTATNGCDSTVTLNLQVLPSVSSSFGTQICPGETYAFGGNNYTTSGHYTTSFTSTNGCDSTVTLNLQVLPSVSSSFGVQICPGETYAFGGNNYTTSGQYTAIFTAANGCDSTVTLNLQVLPSVSSSFGAQICQGESYSFGGNNCSTNGQYMAIFTAANGCDSTVTLNLQVLPSLSSSFGAQICQGETYAFGGNYCSTNGQYMAIFTAANGCDSTVTLNLQVLPSLSSSFGAQICQGETYAFGGNYCSTNGQYMAIFTAANGCDSTVTLNLQVLPSLSSSFGAQICQGETYAFGGNYYTTSGQYTSTFTATNSCDSVVTLNLQVLPSVSSSFGAQICQGETYAFGSNYYTTSGQYTATFTATNGCDSTVTLNLQVLPSVSSSFGAQVCQGESYVFNGNSYSVSGQYTATFSATNGCDSTVTLNLQVLPSMSSSFGAQVCQGESYVFNGSSYSVSGQYTVTFTATNGCDSTVTLNLQVLPSMSSSFGTQICQGESYIFNGNSYSVSGQYTATFTATNGCDSTVTLQLDVLPSSDSFLVYSKCNSDTLYIDGKAYHDFGLYQVVLQNELGCDSTVLILISEADEDSCKLVECDAYIPNAFSPNDDGINDLFMGNSVQVVFNEMLIFDRWGELVHYMFGENPTWDGYFRGEQLNPAVFIYILNGYCKNGEKISLHGDVTLVR